MFIAPSMLMLASPVYTHRTSWSVSEAQFTKAEPFRRRLVRPSFPPSALLFVSPPIPRCLLHAYLPSLPPPLELASFLRRHAALVSERIWCSQSTWLKLFDFVAMDPIPRTTEMR